MVEDCGTSPAASNRTWVSIAFPSHFHLVRFRKPWIWAEMFTLYSSSTSIEYIPLDWSFHIQAYRQGDKFTVQDSWFLDYLQLGDGALTDTGAMQSELGDSCLHGCSNSCREGNHTMESKLCPSLWSPEQIKRCPSEQHLLTVPFHWWTGCGGANTLWRATDGLDSVIVLHTLNSRSNLYCINNLKDKSLTIKSDSFARKLIIFL